MRKFMTAALFALLAIAVVPAGAVASVNQKQEDVLLIKKKKLQAQQKALIEKRKAKQAADKLAADKLAAERAKIKADKLRTASVAPRRACGSFMKCLFGKSRRQTANATGFGGTGLSGNSLRETVAWNDTKYKPGTLIVRTPERALYYVLGDGEAVRYSIGVGREGFQWGGQSKIVAKAEWPTWNPPATMIKREAAKGHMLPATMAGGPGNPLGARAMYIGGTIYRVHGTNNEASIGGAVSSGCIRMMNADVIDLYGRVKIGSPIYVYQ
jgi:lipoprotein-anchoring transpeptidase ErfK/SrfK